MLQELKNHYQRLKEKISREHDRKKIEKIGLDILSLANKLNTREDLVRGLRRLARNFQGKSTTEIKATNEFKVFTSSLLDLLWQVGLLQVQAEQLSKKVHPLDINTPSLTALQHEGILLIERELTQLHGLLERIDADFNQANFETLDHDLNSLEAMFAAISNKIETKATEAKAIAPAITALIETELKRVVGKRGIPMGLRAKRAIASLVVATAVFSGCATSSQMATATPTRPVAELNQEMEARWVREAQKLVPEGQFEGTLFTSAGLVGYSLGRFSSAQSLTRANNLAFGKAQATAQKNGKEYTPTERYFDRTANGWFVLFEESKRVAETTRVEPPRQGEAKGWAEKTKPWQDASGTWWAVGRAAKIRNSSLARSTAHDRAVALLATALEQKGIKGFQRGITFRDSKEMDGMTLVLVSWRQS